MFCNCVCVCGCDMKFEEEHITTEGNICGRCRSGDHKK